MSEKISIIKQLFSNLSNTEKEEFLKYLQKEETAVSKNFNTIKELFSQHHQSDRPCCPHCGSVAVVKNGHKNGIQRFMCKECGKTFTYTNNTILFATKKDISVWKMFCECMLNKYSIQKSAEVCNINTHTAFNWRHKILDALQNMQDEVHLDGVVESDETFFPLNFKGHHKSFRLPRRSHHRGHSIRKRGLSQEMVCVPCIINLNGLSIGKISNLGKPNVLSLQKVINNRIECGSIFVTDNFRAYRKVAFDNNLTHVEIHRGKHTNGTFNIQTINSYHSELKRMVVGKFKGVSTKYLNNYIVYHNFVNFSKDNNKLDILTDYVFTTNCLSKGCNIVNRNPIPVL